ncbi:uncharacterized protein Eint_060620 [Encephalitozoon intestinalis ATCC 50506]|uniref:Uncharacterized protein n=1 Tax=Encephalitozoon intestinalis (strain ATCC 50506) TaxID=876142 RepID=E0S7J1_ENCIT|nr:uncharacterized protein Eint_060620 [Encephalitozoon intestinalis ATCC 50506]ADM11670.1 hypothetical protein Eint_060620 [Encephalitozoon intestinalis ATCC 50506]UTX45407.1 hypothetical protein GPK93_06g09590 [Encephalitozoon intestinalis]
MPLVDFIATFYKKNNILYDTFVGAWLELKECKNIERNLARLLKCLRHEQTSQASYRCLEYFVENEMADFIYRLRDIEENQAAMDFLTDLISILPAKYFPRFNNFLDMVFASEHTDGLALALAYSERTIVLGCRIRTSLVNYSLRFFFDPGLHGDYSRACIVYLICSKRALDHLRSMEFIQAVIRRTNRIYLDLEKTMPLYLSLLNFISYYARKEIDLYKEEIDAALGSQEGTLDPKKIRTHPTTSPLLPPRSNQSSAELCSALHLLEFPHMHPVSIYIEILESTGSSNIRASLIESILADIDSVDDPGKFIRFCAENHPGLLAPYLIRNGGEDWSPIVVLRRVMEMKRERSCITIPYVCHVNRHKSSIIDFLVEKNICDDLVFLFIWVVSKETFLSHFGRIQEMFKAHKTFWANLWNLILSLPA